MLHKIDSTESDLKLHRNQLLRLLILPSPIKTLGKLEGNFKMQEKQRESSVSGQGFGGKMKNKVGQVFKTLNRHLMLNLGP